MTVTYTNSSSVDWTISGALKGDAEFKVINTKVSAELGLGVSRSSVVGSAASSTVPYSLKEDGNIQLQSMHTVLIR